MNSSRRLRVAVGVIACCILASQSFASTNVQELLSSASCSANGQDQAAFYLKVLDKKFPMPSGFDFYGLDRGKAVFKRYITNSVGRSSELTGNTFGYRTYIYYSAADKRSVQALKTQALSITEWQGLVVTYREMRESENYTTYQLAVFSNNEDFIISFVSSSLESIVEIVACSNFRTG